MNSPANTPEATIAGANRAPSSLVQSITAIGWRVLIPASCSVRTTSSPASTPRMPSNRPPVGWVSRWLPIAIGASAGLVPGRVARIVPSRSMLIVMPSASACAMNQRRTATSASPSVSRHIPRSVPGIAPNAAVSVSVAHNRAPSTRRSALMPRSRGAAASSCSGCCPRRAQRHRAADRSPSPRARAVLR